MGSLDVEALLDAAANGDDDKRLSRGGSETEANGGSRNANGNGRHGSRSRSHSRTRDRRRRDNRSLSPRSETARTPRSDAGSHRSSKRRSRSRDRERDRDRDRDRDREREPRGRNGRRRNRRGRGGDRGGGDEDDMYPPRSGRSRSNSPNRYYRPRGWRRDRDDDRDRRDRDRDRRRRDDRDDRGRRDRSRESTPPLTEEERDRRTVFVQQLAARLRTRELKEFFEKAGSVAEAQIVKDRVSNRSKGVGYVEFKSEESVAAALQLTGQKLLGIPVIVQVTEAEKNRLARSTAAAAAANGNANGASNGSGGNSNGTHGGNAAEAVSNGSSAGMPFHRLYVGNIHFSITDTDLRNVFEPFGDLEFVQLPKDDSGRSRGYGFVQFRDSEQAREALEKMNGFDLAGRAIRVGLGNDKFTPDSSANLIKGLQGRDHLHQGGGRGQGGSSGNFDRVTSRDNDKGSGASALDDTDVAGVNFSVYSRDALMRKLARVDEVPSASAGGGASASGSDDPSQRQEQTLRQPILKPRSDTKPLPVNVNMASRCVVLHNMFNAAEEEGDEWAKELEDDVRQEAETKYGHVVHVALDPNSNGDIYLKFDKVQGGENAIKGLNGRYFGGRMIMAAPVVDAVYSSLFSRTKAI